MTDGVARIKLGLADTLALGNLDAHRDWGFAGDYVRAMWLMLQQDEADDYVIATGVSHSVQRSGRDRVRRTSASTGSKHVKLDPALPPAGRSRSPDRRLPSKAQRELGWEPSVDFKRLVEMMVDADLERCSRTAVASPRAAY